MLDQKEKEQTPSTPRRQKRKMITVVAVIVIAAVILCVGFVQGGKWIRYNEAMTLKESGDYAAAEDAFQKMGDYQDASEEAVECGYLQGKKLMEDGKFDEARVLFLEAGAYRDARELILECEYRTALELMEESSYEEAYAMFDSLGDYNDSTEQRWECLYRMGKDAYEQGDFESARDTLTALGEYKDARSLYDSSCYEIALAAFDAGNYGTAYDALTQISNDSMDVFGMLRECAYHLTLKSYETGRVEDAFYWAMELEALGGAPRGMDSSVVKKAKLNYAENLIATKTESGINEAISLLCTMDTSKDVKSLIARAEDQLLQNRYDAAEAMLMAGKYEDAADAFAQIKNFSDAKTQWLESMYQYVQKNKAYFDESASALKKLIGTGDRKETFYQYAEVLSKNRYKDSQTYYKELTAWRVEITMNNMTDNEEKTRMDCISKYDFMCAHLTLSGGPLNGKTKPKCVFTLPSGSKVTVKTDEDWQEGTYGTYWCYYNTPSKAPGGTCTVKVYDGAGNLIGKSSIRVIG